MLIKINVTEELLTDLIITALEGGSNYWYDLNRDDINMAKKQHHPDVRDSKATSELVAISILSKGFKLPVYERVEDEDDEQGDILGYLSKDSIKEGLVLMAEKDPNNFGSLFIEGWDAVTADVFFQYVVLKKIVYG